MNEFCVYLHFRPDGTPFYVGKGKPRRAKEFTDRNKYHKHIVAKHGRDNIEVLIFQRESEQAAFADEILWIKTLREAGYSLANICDGGEGASGAVRTLEQRKTMSEAKKRMTVETKAKISAWHKGKKQPRESVEKMKANHRHAKPWLGKHHSEETKRKLSEANKGKKRSAESRAKATATLTAWWARRKENISNTGASNG